MYKKLLTALMSIMICTFFSTAIVFAGEATYNGDGDGGFRIADTGVGPGIGYDTAGADADPLYLSAKSAARYTGDAGAGGFGAGGTAGAQWAIVTGSTRAKDELALEFMMRGSQNQEDNNLYQHLTTGIAAASALSAPTTDPVGTWIKRGTGGS